MVSGLVLSITLTHLEDGFIFAGIARRCFGVTDRGGEDTGVSLVEVLRSH